MKTRLLAVVVGVLAATASADDVAVKKELETFTGSWQAVAVEHDGKQAPEEQVKSVKLTVRGDKYAFQDGEQVIEGTHKLDPSKDPKQIDAIRSKGPDAGKTIRGIYILDALTFKVCFAPAGKDRPTAFATKEGEGQRLLIFKRVKP
jgi:uncharacterized protein (TIGR03067 family)